MFRAPQWIVTYFFQIMSYKKFSLKDQLTLEMIIINQIMFAVMLENSITTSKSKCSSVNSTLGEFLLLCKQHKLSSLIDKVNVLLTFSAGSENDNSSTAHSAVWGGTKAFLLRLWVSFISPTCGGVSLPVRRKWRKSIPETPTLLQTGSEVVKVTSGEFQGSPCQPFRVHNKIGLPRLQHN